MNTSLTFKFGQTCSTSIDMATSPSKCRFGVTDSSNHQEISQTSPVRSINCSSANMNLNYNSDSNSDCQTDAIDLSVKGNFEPFSEKRFYCPAEGCVFSKGMGKSFKKKMLVDQHFLNCHSERKYRCPTCGKSYAIEWQLRYHSKTCGIDWVCMSCHKVYKERLSLITHCRRHNHLLPVNAKIKKHGKDGTGVIASSASGTNSSSPFDHNNNANSPSLQLEQQHHHHHQQQQQQQQQQLQQQHSLFQQQLHFQHQQQQQQHHLHQQQLQQQQQQQQFANNVFKLNYSLNQPNLDSHSFNESAVQLLHLAHLANSAFANAADNPDDERSASPKDNNCNSMINLNLAMAASKPFRMFRRSNNNFD